MKYCTKCGKETEETSFFCSSCGNEFDKKFNVEKENIELSPDENIFDMLKDRISTFKGWLSSLVEKLNEYYFLKPILYSIPLLIIGYFLIKSILPLQVPDSVIGCYYTYQEEYDYFKINSDKTIELVADNTKSISNVIITTNDDDFYTFTFSIDNIKCSGEIVKYPSGSGKNLHLYIDNRQYNFFKSAQKEIPKVEDVESHRSYKLAHLFEFLLEEKQTNILGMPNMDGDIRIADAVEFVNNTFMIKLAPNIGSGAYMPSASITGPCKDMVSNLIKFILSNEKLKKYSLSIGAYGSKLDPYGNSTNVKLLECYYSANTLSKINSSGEYDVQAVADRWNYVF